VRERWKRIMSVAAGSFARLLVLFRLGRHRFALPAENVVEICEAPEGALGAGSFQHRERALPVIDLRERFQVEAAGEPRAVLVTMPPGSSDPLALLVDEVDGVVPFGAESLLELPDPLHPFLGGYLQGLCIVPGETSGDAAGVVAVLGLGSLGIGDASGGYP